MSIPLPLLKLTDFRGVGTCVYGGPGMKKTLAVHTLPPPILAHDFEGGMGCLNPWIRRRKQSGDSTWTDVTQEDRESAFSLLRKELQEKTLIKPSPRIDIISYDTMFSQSWNDFTIFTGNFQPASYCSVVVDSLQEFSFDTQTYSKSLGSMSSTDPMHVKLWGGAQERAAIQLRVLKNFRDLGVFIYLIGSEQIDKDYVNDPREAKNSKDVETPYSVKATVNVPGKLTGVIPHLVDIMLHARPQNQEVVWVAKPEPLPAGNCSWEAKERWGRLPMYNLPDFRTICITLYGQENARAIYSQGGQAASVNS